MRSGTSAMESSSRSHCDVTSLLLDEKASTAARDFIESVFELNGQVMHSEYIIVFVTKCTLGYHVRAQRLSQELLQLSSHLCRFPKSKSGGTQGLRQ